MIAGIALLLVLAAPPADQGAAAPKNEIVVRGVSLRSLDEDLKRCVAQRCPVRQDVVASVRYAEALFRSSRYVDARKILQQAIMRDRGQGAADPDAVAALYEATVTVASHEGEQEVARRAVYDRSRLLHEARPDDVVGLLSADFDVADFELHRGVPLRAEEVYRRLGERAEAAHQPTILAAVRLRLAEIADGAGRHADATRLLDQIADPASQAPRGYRLAALALKARLARARGDDSATQALMAALSSEPQARPVLLYNEQPQRPTDIDNLNYFNSVETKTTQTAHFGLRWADVGFSIRTDGTVDMLEVLRGNLGKGDADAILKAVARRRYSALPPAEGELYRVERWTLTADYDTPVDSLIRRRTRNPHYETLDITTDAPPALGGAAHGSTR